jgi:hypothetical protein
VRAAAIRARGRRGRKEILPGSGQVFNLGRMYRSLNRQYFHGSLHVKRVGWSVRWGRKVLGHYDPAHQTIVISRSLDSPSVPDYVVLYLLYHEMIHAYLGEKFCNGRRAIHGPEFRKMEQRFPRLGCAQAFIRRHFSAP